MWPLRGQLLDGVAVHGAVQGTVDHALAVREDLPVDEARVQLARLEVFHPLALLLVHQAAGEDQVRLAAVAAGSGRPARIVAALADIDVYRSMRREGLDTADAAAEVAALLNHRLDAMASASHRTTEE